MILPPPRKDMSIRNSFSSRSKYYVSLRSLIFSAHNPFSGFWIWIPWKFGHIEENFYIMSPFSRQSGHIRKKIFVMSHVNIIIGHFYHLYVYMSHLAVSEGLFLSSFCLYVPCSCHSRTFLPFSRLYVPLLYAPGYFSTFILYMSRLVLSAGFYVEQKCFAKGNPYICWFQ